MKRNLALTSLIIGLGATAAFMSGCNKATQREAELDSKLQGSVFEIKNIPEVTSASATVLSNSGEVDLKGMSVGETKLDQQPLEGQAKDILGKLKGSKKAVDTQLKTGAIGFVIMGDQLKIVKITDDTTSLESMSLQYMSALKSLSISTKADEQAKLQTAILSLKRQSPAELKENFGVVELASLKITAYGVLDNKKTDYGERTSKLVVVPTPFEFATQIVVEAEE